MTAATVLRRYRLDFVIELMMLLAECPTGSKAFTLKKCSKQAQSSKNHISLNLGLVDGVLLKFLDQRKRLMQKYLQLFDCVVTPVLLSFFHPYILYRSLSALLGQRLFQAGFGLNTRRGKRCVDKMITEEDALGALQSNSS